MTALLFFLGGAAYGQSALRFICQIDGFENVGGSLRPVTGTGTLSLLGVQLYYQIQVPNIVNLPAETHFHADGSMLRTSLANYTYTPGDGR